MPLWVPSALRPPAMSETCVPWPSKSIGLGSGASASVFGQVSPTKSIAALDLGRVRPEELRALAGRGRGVGLLVRVARGVAVVAGVVRLDRARAAQVLVGEVDAGVEHRDLHAGAVVALVADLGGLHVVRGLGQAAGAARVLPGLVARRPA